MSHHHRFYSLSLRFILVLSACFLISLCKPAAFLDAEETQVESPTVQNAYNLTNITTEGKHLLDLYRNITNNSSHRQTEANIIKSLNFVKRNTVGDCEDEFNFTLAAVDSSEFIVQSKLRLYLEQIPLPSTVPAYTVEIKAKLSNGNLTEAAVMKDIIRTEACYIEFEVSDLVRHLISNESHAVFKVQVYESDRNLESLVHTIPNKELKFVNDDVEEERMPVLLVYTYDQKLEHVGYEMVAKRTRQVRGTPQDKSSPISQTRRKRAISTGCGVLSLNVGRLEIPRDILGRGTRFTVYLPNEYDAGICGGRCHSRLPHHSPSKHAGFIHILLDRSNFRNQHNLNFTQCCAPVEYGELELLGQMLGARLTIVYIPNMIITTCECLDIAV